ncbi:hypothetical protein [Bacillus sp. T3]|uniref:hypothetical protein n=1 Tax=Bacillus sp. T3 TaxID=467262 RepID=UPI002980AF50|nr:hypothetical protein [Bacillus sp. T3]
MIGDEYEYETYYFLYENLISEYLFEVAPAFFLKHAPKMKTLYKDTVGIDLNESILMDILYDLLVELAMDYTEDIQEEYITDLAKLCEVPFDEVSHLKIFEHDLEQREKRKAEELAEIQRKKQEEARIIKDVFGIEYSPSVGGIFILSCILVKRIQGKLITL